MSSDLFGPEYVLHLYPIGDSSSNDAPTCPILERSALYSRFHPHLFQHVIHWTGRKSRKPHAFVVFASTDDASRALQYIRTQNQPLGLSCGPLSPSDWAKFKSLASGTGLNVTELTNPVDASTAVHASTEVASMNTPSVPNANTWITSEMDDDISIPTLDSNIDEDGRSVVHGPPGESADLGEHLSDLKDSLAEVSTSANDERLGIVSSHSTNEAENLQQKQEDVEHHATLQRSEIDASFAVVQGREAKLSRELEVIRERMDRLTLELRTERKISITLSRRLKAAREELKRVYGAGSSYILRAEVERGAFGGKAEVCNVASSIDTKG